MKRTYYKYLILLSSLFHTINIFIFAHIAASTITGPMYIISRIFLPLNILCLALTIVLFIKTPNR